jgi:nicotinate-nucleotide pyrophosphorylase (carboxylating)
VTPLDPATYRDLVRRAIEEDVGPGDLTSSLVIPTGMRARGDLVAHAGCVVCGLGVAAAVFEAIDPAIRFDARLADGDAAAAGTVLATIAGPAAALLAAERTALNFLQHLSGIATLTRRFVDAAGGRAVILDTRKTIPTWRELAKYAVRCGGGRNHRMGLYDAVLIKDNHVDIAGGVRTAIERARAGGGGAPIEVEARTLADVGDALDAGAETILLDNFGDEDVARAVAIIGGRAKVEVSGGVTLARVPQLAAIGVDFISVGALTHSAPAADISLEIDARAGSDSR